VTPVVNEYFAAVGGVPAHPRPETSHLSKAFSEIAKQLMINLQNNITLKKIQGRLNLLIKQVASQVRTFEWRDAQGRAVQVRSPKTIIFLLQKLVLHGKVLSDIELRMLHGLRQRALTFIAADRPHLLLLDLIEYADQLYPVPAQYGDGLVDEVVEDGAAVADLQREAPVPVDRRETRAQRALRLAAQREIADAHHTHPLARALLIRYITERHNSLLNAEVAEEMALMCREFQVFPRSSLRHDPRLLFVHLPPTAFLAFFWEVVHPRGRGNHYYLGGDELDLNQQPHIRSIYGSVFNVEAQPFTLRQHFWGDREQKKHLLRSIYLNQYGVRVMHTHIGLARKIVRITPEFLAEKLSS
jgi:hypothetical protein